MPPSIAVTTVAFWVARRPPEDNASVLRGNREAASYFNRSTRKCGWRYRVEIPLPFSAGSHKKRALARCKWAIYDFDCGRNRADLRDSYKVGIFLQEQPELPQVARRWPVSPSSMWVWYQPGFARHAFGFLRDFAYFYVFLRFLRVRQSSTFQLVMKDCSFFSVKHKYG